LEIDKDYKILKKAKHGGIGRRLKGMDLKDSSD
jgi:hypothetical protein